MGREKVKCIQYKYATKKSLEVSQIYINHNLTHTHRYTDIRTRTHTHSTNINTYAHTHTHAVLHMCSIYAVVRNMGISKKQRVPLARNQPGCPMQKTTILKTRQYMKNTGREKERDRKRNSGKKGRTCVR